MKFNLKKQYELCWDYLKECKIQIYSIIGIFVLFALIGFFVPASAEITEQIMSFIQELIAQTEGMSQAELVGFIFFNNLQSSFIGFLFGFALGIFPVIAAVANGYLLGFVGAIAVEADGFLTLFRLLPHGIFELPAIFISLGMGMKFGSFVFQKNKSKSFRDFFWNGLRVFLYVVVPLLIIAGIIEGSLIFLSG